MPLEKRRRSTASTLIVPLILSLALLLSGRFLSFLSPPAPAEQSASRRSIFLVAGAAAIAGTSAEPSRAEQAWQMQLPQKWKVIQQQDESLEEPVVLLQAQDEEFGGIINVYHFPIQLQFDDAEAQASADATAKTMIGHFTSPIGKPALVSAEKAVENIVLSQQAVKGTSKFNLLGSPLENVVNGNRYVRYDYESKVCPGSFKKGDGPMDFCYEDDANTKEFPFDERRHVVQVTLVDESKAYPEELGKGPFYYAWVLDIGVPKAYYKNLQPIMDKCIQSFEVGSAEVLEAEMNKNLGKQEEELRAAVAAEKKAEMSQAFDSKNVLEREEELRARVKAKA